MANTVPSRKPVPPRMPSDLSAKMNDLSLEIPGRITEEPRSYFVTSPTPSEQLQPGDELLEVESIQSPGENESNKPSAFKTAYKDVRHFAGGLISHPYEASKHFSVLRHSHGLVYYKGFNTNVAITVFGDQPLPADRQFWLQKRGFSGRTGLKIGASIFGVKSAWLNVTPTTCCTAEHLPPSDERAWQRDIEKFVKKAGKDVRHHRALETNILRIPCSAEDGYFRVVLCTGERGKKTLCPSPIFRLVSTSASMGSIRGASLSTLPLEVGMKIGQFVARQAAVNAAAPMASTAAQTVKSMIPWQPSALAQTAASSAYGMSGVPARMEDAYQRSEEADQAKIDQFVAQFQDQLDHAEAIGSDDGPEQPYPVRFSAKVIRGTGQSGTEMNIPTANLVGLPDDILLRLSGTYCGWITFVSTKEVNLPSELLDEWHQAIITVSPRVESKAAVVMKKDVRAYLIRDFQGGTFFDAKLSVMVMARLRPQARNLDISSTKNTENELMMLLKDIAVTEASLNRPAWSADQILTRSQTDKSNRSLSERYADARGSVQKQADKVPLHWAGVRTDSMAIRDRLVGNGGVFVPR